MKYTWFKKMTWMGKAALFIIVMILMIGIFAPYLSMHPPKLPSGAPLQAPSKLHWLGTDDLGIDLWAQICYGARISILVGIGTALLTVLIGGGVGILAGYLGGLTDRFLMRFTDMLMALPDLPVMIILGAFLGPKLSNIILVLVLFSWTVPARIVRSKIISIKEENYVKAAQYFGAGFWHLTVKHFLPQIIPLMMISMVKTVSKAIVAEASLSFLGLGDPTSKSWGLILHHALNFQGIYFTVFWRWWIVAPLVAIVILVTAVAFIGRDLEQIVDTKL